MFKKKSKASSPTNGIIGSIINGTNGHDQLPMSQQQLVKNTAPPPPPSLVFHCQLANGSPTGLITGFSSVKELYQKIAECYDFSVDEVICTITRLTFSNSEFPLSYRSRSEFRWSFEWLQTSWSCWNWAYQIKMLIRKVGLKFCHFLSWKIVENERKRDNTAGWISDKNVFSFDIKKRFHCLFVEE